MDNLSRFSEKQKRLLTWWTGADSSYDAIICDGAIRSGKTVCMSLSFVFWAFSRFDDQMFAFCGKTVRSLKRNVIASLISRLKPLGFHCVCKESSNLLEISYRGKANRFYLFGGKDEGSAALIQGMTLAGILFDEVALMPRSFVEQGLARCSVAGSKFWFNCNPEYPFHWFYREWIKKSEEKNALYLHFEMTDNPSLSPEMLKRYQSLYTGAFYDRFILGKWSAVSGQVYPMFSPEKHVVKELPKRFERQVISCDYGIVNPTSMGLWGLSEGVWYRIREYYYDSHKSGLHHTDEEYYTELVRLAGGLAIEQVVVDPSASSFMECIRRHGQFCVTPAKNDVVTGIGLVSDALVSRTIRFHESCEDTLREFSLYCWNDDGASDSVKKVHDHAMDDIRYFVSTILSPPADDFFVLSTARGRGGQNPLH